MPSNAKDGSAKGGAATQELWIETRKRARDSSVDMYDEESGIDPRLHIMYYSTLNRMRADSQALPDNLEECNSFWYVGVSGTGKTHKSVTENPGAYNKLPNKWWDGYDRNNSAHVDCVIMQDFDKRDANMAYHLKIWADKFAFSAEVKGGGLTLRPKKFIVTSNYFPQEIWPNDQDIKAIRRRFKIVYFYRDEMENEYDFDESIKVVFGNIMETVQI